MIYSLRCQECSFESIDKRKFDNHLKTLCEPGTHGNHYSLFICSQCSACSTSQSIIEEHQNIYHKDEIPLDNMKVIESKEDFVPVVDNEMANSPEKTDTSSGNSIEDRNTVKDSTSSVDSDIKISTNLLQDCIICKAQIPQGQNSLIEHFKTAHNLPKSLTSNFLPLKEDSGMHETVSLDSSQDAREQSFNDSGLKFKENDAKLPWQNILNQFNGNSVHKLMQTYPSSAAIKCLFSPVSGEQKMPISSTPEASPTSSLSPHQKTPLNSYVQSPNGPQSDRINPNVFKLLTDFLQNSMRQSPSIQGCNNNNNNNINGYQKMALLQSQLALSTEANSSPTPANPNKRSFFNLNNIMNEFVRKSNNNNNSTTESILNCPSGNIQSRENIPIGEGIFPGQNQPFSLDSKRKKFDFEQILASQKERIKSSAKRDEFTFHPAGDNQSFSRNSSVLTESSNNNDSSTNTPNSTTNNSASNIINGVVHNTMRKTKSDMKVIQRYIIQTKHDSREIHDMPPDELNQYVQDFIVTAKKKDGHEYEPESLKAFVHSLERHLKYHNYPYSVLKDNAFQGIRNVLNQRLHELRSIIRTSGNGNGQPTPTDSTGEGGQFVSGKMNQETGSQNDSESIYTAPPKPPTGASLMRDGLLGLDNPQALLNSLWLMNRTQFNVGGTQRHRNLLWGQFNLIGNDSVIQFNSMNNESNSDIRYCRGHGGSGNNTAMGTNNHGSNMNKILTVQMQPIQCTGSGKRLPMPFNCIDVFQLYAKLRPIQSNGPNEPFYLCPDPNWEHGGPWFKPIGAGTQIISRIPRMLGLKPSRDLIPTVQPKITSQQAQSHEQSLNRPNILNFSNNSLQQDFSLYSNATGNNSFASDYLKTIMASSNNSIDNFKNFARMFLNKTQQFNKETAENLINKPRQNDENYFFNASKPTSNLSNNLNNDSAEHSDDGHCSSVNQPNSFDDNEDDDDSFGDNNSLKNCPPKESGTIYDQIKENVETSV